MSSMSLQSFKAVAVIVIFLLAKSDVENILIRTIRQLDIFLSVTTISALQI